MTNRDIVFSPEECTPCLENASALLAKLFSDITNVSDPESAIEFQHWSKGEGNGIWLTFAGGQVSTYEVFIPANDTPFTEQMSVIGSYFYAFYWDGETDGEDTSDYN